MTNFLTDNLDLYERLHFHELETREHVSSRLQVSLGLVAALAGALSFLIGSVDRTESGIGIFSFWILLGISGLGLLYAAYQLKIVFWGNTYKEVPSAEAVKQHEVDLCSHYFDDPLPPEVASAADKQKAATQLFVANFKDFLIEKYVICATHNARVNVDRANRLHEANRGILVSAGFAFLAYLVFAFGDLQSHRPAQVQLTAPIDVSVLAAPRDLLKYGNAVESSTNEHHEPAATAAAQDPSGATARAPDQGGREQAAPTSAKTQGALK